MKFYPNRFLNVRFLYAGFYCIQKSNYIIFKNRQTGRDELTLSIETDGFKS